jgi:hypothetical protein
LHHEVKGPPFVLKGGVGGFPFCQVMICVESGLSTVHFPLGQWTFHVKFFSFFFLGGGESRQRVPKFLTCSSKSSQ